MPVGGKPILLRVMDIYARQGLTDFRHLRRHRKEVIFDYFEGRDFGWTIDIVDPARPPTPAGASAIAATCSARPSWRPMATPVGREPRRDSSPSTAGRASSPPSPRCRCARNTHREYDRRRHHPRLPREPVLREHWINAGFIRDAEGDLRPLQGDTSNATSSPPCCRAATSPATGMTASSSRWTPTRTSRRSRRCSPRAGCPPRPAPGCLSAAPGPRARPLPTTP